MAIHISDSRHRCTVQHSAIWAHSCRSPLRSIRHLGRRQQRCSRPLADLGRGKRRCGAAYPKADIGTVAQHFHPFDVCYAGLFRPLLQVCQCPVQRTLQQTIIIDTFDVCCANSDTIDSECYAKVVFDRNLKLLKSH